MEVRAGGLAERASEAHRLAEAKPAEEVALASRVVEQARQDRDFAGMRGAEALARLAAIRSSPTMD